MTKDDGPTTITEAAGFIRRGEFTPVELLEQCLARFDRYEDRVRAWVYLDRDGAREQAERLTAELKQNNYRGPLHGIPVGIKDIIDVFDMPTGCGSKLWANSYARRDATVVERLRQAGAIIMGKTVTTAYASFDPPVTRNPWNLDRTPGGSSSGSAAAVACGMCLGALATQTGGSITRPASYCGVCSIKPTYGRVSVDGVLPLAPSMDHVGAMANCVRDLAILLQAIAGYDRRDPACSSEPVNDYVVRLEHPEQPHLARLRGAFDDKADATIRTVMEEIVQPRLKPKPLPLPPEFQEVFVRHHHIMAVEAAQYHQQRLRRHPEDYPPRIRGLIEDGTACPAPEYLDCLRHKEQLTVSMVGLCETANALITLATTSGPPAGDTTGNPAMNSPWSYTGLPTVSLPVAWSGDGLPIAIQLTGDQLFERDLLVAAAWVEQVIGFERRPLPL
jgi:aspartyl-tRNA(Asn)/glutamyl-tRNA(Gln) amidotransferase subunit A